VKRETLDELFPTIVRYCGLALAIALTVATILGHGLEVAAGYVLAMGMIAYKTVREAANGDRK
jgi:hypothetical protein